MGMYGYLAALSSEAVRFLGREPDFDTFMGLLNGENGLEIGQMWDAVDRVVSTLLDGEASLMSGTPVTDDLGYGPAMFLSVADVRAMAASLSGVSESRLADAFASTGVMDRYPDLRDRPDEMAMLESCAVASTRDTLALFERAAVHQLGIIFVVV
jgi:Domain of unknown function (DUF1877)